MLRAHGSFGVLEVSGDHARGHPDNPLSDAELLQKFHANTALAGLDEPASTALANELMEIDTQVDVVPLLTRLGRIGPQATRSS